MDLGNSPVFIGLAFLTAAAIFIPLGIWQIIVGEGPVLTTESRGTILLVFGVAYLLIANYAGAKV